MSILFLYWFMKTNYILFSAWIYSDFISEPKFHCSYLTKLKRYIAVFAWTTSVTLLKSTSVFPFQSACNWELLPLLGGSKVFHNTFSFITAIFPECFYRFSLTYSRLHHNKHLTINSLCKFFAITLKSVWPTDDNYTHSLLCYKKHKYFILWHFLRKLFAYVGFVFKLSGMKSSFILSPRHLKSHQNVKLQ